MNERPVNTSGMTPDEQYVWDATGSPDPSTRAIESALGTQRYSGKPLALPSRRFRVPGRWPALAIAAAVLLAITLSIYFVVRASRSVYGGWTVASSTGRPDMQKLQGATPRDQGARVTTDASSTAVLTLKQTASVEVKSATDVTLTGEPAVHLASGEATVSIPATLPPTKVEAGPLGCTLAPGTIATIYNRDGVTSLRVASGWAEVSSSDESLRLAASQGCQAGPKSTTLWPPYRIAKNNEFPILVKKIDEVLNSKTDEKSQYLQLQEAMKTAKPEDAALLWNLLPRVTEFQRGPVRDRLAKLVKNPPSGRAFDEVLTLDKDAMDAWWNAVLGR